MQYPQTQTQLDVENTFLCSVRELKDRPPTLQSHAVTAMVKAVDIVDIIIIFSVIAFLFIRTPDRKCLSQYLLQLYIIYCRKHIRERDVVIRAMYLIINVFV